MSKYRKLPIIGAPLAAERWPGVEQMAIAVEECGMEVIKILNFIEGSVKLIASPLEGETLEAVEERLSDGGFKMVSPYTSHGKIVGYKVVKYLEKGEQDGS